ncbi:hypothetical protein [Streptomyces filamentosus]|uniref:hypothetical protein n=1 Tax=Streptomyces filamentosus TaxID=67294 RepID=UPI0033DB5A29
MAERTKPSWYQVSTEDRMIHPDNERRMAARMNPRKTIELDASHASLASRPRETCDLIDLAVRETSWTRPPGAVRVRSVPPRRASGRRRAEHETEEERPKGVRARRVTCPSRKGPPRRAATRSSS